MLLTRYSQTIPSYPNNVKCPHHTPQYSSSNPLLASLSDFENNYSQNQNDDDDTEARSQFGTKSYWDAMYDGMGDFSSDEYSWYYGWETIKPFVSQYVLDDDCAGPKSQLSVLIPGCGNDPLLLDLYNAGYRCLTAFDYSSGAIERQRALFEYLPMGSDVDHVELRVEDARCLPIEWDNKFDVIIEKGALDAIYLSGDGNFQKSTEELKRVLRVGGICISVSGVVPVALRNEGFAQDNWQWLRDGSDDLKAGCFVFKKLK